MRFLAPGNTEFAKSTGLPLPGNFRSRRLKRLLNALVQYQNAHSLANLQEVMYAVAVWRRYNPKEVFLRGKKLGQLDAEIETARSLYTQVDQGRNALAGMRRDQAVQAAQGPGRADWARDMQDTGDALALEIRHAEQSLHARGAIDLGGADDEIVITDGVLHQKFPVLRKIEITDLPNGGAGQYYFTDTNTYSEADRTQASMTLRQTGVMGNATQRNPKYWLLLGKLVTTPRMNRHYGRCLSCAAAVIKELVEDPVYDDLIIEHVGSVKYDHHLVLVGRQNSDGRTNAGLADRANWGEGIVLDVWQGNLRPPQRKYVYNVANCKYASEGELKYYCAFTPEQRAEHRAFLAGVNTTRPQHAGTTFLAQRRQIQNDAQAGLHTTQNYVQVKGPNGRMVWRPAATA